ncbi:MAG: hypothetical protein RSC44_01025 [Clostridia bacterium]
MNKNWSNTVLVAYSALPKIVNELDFGVSTRVKSSFGSIHLKNGVSTEQLIGEIAELNNEKRKIVNLRIITVDAMNKLDDLDRQLLIARIMRKKTFQQISTDFNLSLRTVFRKLKAAEESFAFTLAASGYSEEWLESEYSNNKYISAIHQRILNDAYFVAKSM